MSHPLDFRSAVHQKTLDQQAARLARLAGQDFPATVPISTDQAGRLRHLMAHLPAGPREVSLTRAHSLAVTGGKGGVGKSVVALSLAAACARQGMRVGLVDGNSGVGNLELMCGCHSYWNLAHVIRGSRKLLEVIVQGPLEIQILPGASDLTELSEIPQAAMAQLEADLAQWESQLDLLIIDTGSGLHRLVRLLASVADTALIITQPEAPALADAYATLKSLSSEPNLALRLVANRCPDVETGLRLSDRVRQTAKSFLKRDIHAEPGLPEDPLVPQAISQRTTICTLAPDSHFAQAMARLARSWSAGRRTPDAQASYFSRFLNRWGHARSFESPHPVKQPRVA